MKPSNPILVGCLEDAIWIRVEGKGSFENSGPIKEFSSKMIDEGHRHFIVDLENCPVMDSTFMGTLTGVALRLAQEEEEPDDVACQATDSDRSESFGLEVINANPRCRQLMVGLGLDHIFQLDEDGGAHREQSKLVSRQIIARNEDVSDIVTGKPVEKSATGEVMLEAHEALSEACEQNVPRFRDVIEFLKKDLGLPINRPA